MGERKVLNKYYPPDFDPAKIPKRKQLKNLQMKVRMMLPMSIRCNTCGTYMYKGTKFNCRKEDVVGDTYLGLLKFRFYFKCTKCSAELVMKTDPKNSDYEMEFGASRNFEPWRDADEAKDAAVRQREEEEMGDAMKALENRTMDSKMEMDILAGLDEVRSLRSRQAKIDQDALLGALKRSATGEEASKQQTEQELEEEDEKLIKSIVFRNSQSFVRRIHDDDDDDDKDGDSEGDETDDEEAAKGGDTDDDGKAGKEVDENDDEAAAKGGDGDVPSQSADSVARGDLKREAPTTNTLHREVKKRKVPSTQAICSKDTGGDRFREGSSAAASSLSGRVVNTSTGLLLIDNAEEQKPIFEVKPVKVSFAVKEKKSKLQDHTSAKGVGHFTHEAENSVASPLEAVGAQTQQAPFPAPPRVRTSPSVGLSLLAANYCASDEDSL